MPEPAYPPWGCRHAIPAASPTPTINALTLDDTRAPVPDTLMSPIVTVWARDLAVRYNGRLRYTAATPPPMTSSDQDLARNYVQGNGDAVRAVDSWIVASLWPFRARMPHGWEDAAQDARVELLRRLGAGEFRGDAGLKTYVWRVATHAAITRIRRETVRRADPIDDLPLASDASSALDHLLKVESDAVVQRVLAEASVPCRDLWRALLLGRSYAEISEQTGVSEGALRVRVLRCRQAAIAARSRFQPVVAETTATLERQS